MFQQISKWCSAALCWLLSGISLLLPLGRWLPADCSPDGLFNRYVIRYTSQVPLKGEISYRIGSCERTEVFYLEAGADPAEFTSFIDGFLDGELARDLGEPELRVLGGAAGAYEIVSISTERVQAPKNTHIQLEDEFCSIGADLRWGGALDSFAWKAAPAGYSNLFNRHDAGRLVQQSYYGTSDPPYEMGNFNGEPWPYNPVQGGDLYTNCSKLVDYELRDSEIYVKCLPLEWGKDNVPSLSYMENTYRLEDGVLVVENRFVDFSGYTHENRHQEMPAFYVVSALGTFNYYNGNAPWTNAPLTQLSNLPFWGGGVAECYMDLLPGNTETWCAWTDGTQPTSFGVGIYNPDTEILLAGRSGSEVSKDPENNSTSYVAPLRTLQFKSFEPLEYSYYVTAGSLAEMRAAFGEIQ